MSADVSTNGYLSGSNLEKVLRSGAFAVTGEVGPPQSADAKVVRDKANIIKSSCDAANLTDNQTAIVRMSSIGAGTLVLNEGLEPIIQMVCRDRNRLAMQSDLLGAYALAIAINLGRGRAHIGCGCGLGAASGDDPALSWWLVARNLALGAVALVAVLPPSQRELGLLDWLTLVFAVLACVALYSAASQLLRNGAAIASWRKPRD
mgnify:CR=1 FL=1